jgi:nitrate reductase gamma subunit
VPHENAKRAAHGGSHFEDTDWWTRKIKSNRLGELKAMAAEILFLKGLWQFNRKLWFWSYAFHAGLYLAICAGLGMVATAVMAMVAPAAVAGSVLHPACTAAGSGGVVLILAGATGLLVRRLRDAKLRAYTTPGDIVNLCFFIATAAMLLWSKAGAAGSQPFAAIAKGLLTFDTTLGMPGQQAVAVAMAALLILYIPLTHMAHFIAKYFTYHAVRWDDRSTCNEPAIEAKIAEYLTYRPRWSAAHMGADEGATWAEVVSRDPTKRATK